jgi:hypothetical protein
MESGHVWWLLLLVLGDPQVDFLPRSGHNRLRGGPLSWQQFVVGDATVGVGLWLSRFVS